MNDAKPILSRWLVEDDYETLGQAIVNGYHGCNKLIEKNIVLSEFAVGREFRSHLLRLFIEHQLNTIPQSKNGFSQEIRPNLARNCWHVRLHKGGLIITSHFMGKNKFRKLARPAKNRIGLAGINGDLFGFNESDSNLLGYCSHLHCNLLHGGTNKPELSLLAIPTPDQKSVSAVCNLPRPSIQSAKAEEITDELVMMLREQTENEDKEFLKSTK